MLQMMHCLISPWIPWWLSLQPCHENKCSYFKQFFTSELSFLLFKMFWKATSWVNCPNTQMTWASLPTRITKSCIFILILSVTANGCDRQSRNVIVATVKFMVLSKALGVKLSCFFCLWYLLWRIIDYLSPIIEPCSFFFGELLLWYHCSTFPHILFVLLYKIQEYKLSKKTMNWGQINDCHCLGNKIGHYKLIEI